MKIKSLSRLLLVVLSFALIAPGSAFARQNPPAEPLMIVVTDPTGAVVAHARIEISPAPANATGMYSDSDGKFTVSLEPGPYRVSVTQRGFKPWTRRVDVQAGASQMVGVRLEIASSSGLAVECPPGGCFTDGKYDFDGKSWWEHVKFLADDKLEGRDTGSRGEREAEKYAVEQLKKAGAEPAGVDGFYQPVGFISRRIVEKDSSLALVRDGKREPLVLGEDALISARVMPARKVKAALVFAGYGLKVPESNYDDFAGIDLNGKIAVIFSGSPAQIPGSSRFALPDDGGAMEGAARGGRGGRGDADKSGVDGYSVVAHCAEP